MDWHCTIQVSRFYVVNYAEKTHHIPFLNPPHLLTTIQNKRPYGLPVAYRKLFKNFESIMSSHDGRPHWAKAHSLGPAMFRQHYPQFDRFVQVLKATDPEGMLTNPYVRRHILGDTTGDVGERVYKDRA